MPTAEQTEERPSPPLLLKSVRRYQSSISNKESCAIFSGSKFKGVQKSGRNCYDVKVELQVGEYSVCHFASEFKL
ncbi:hypothetical protein HK096_003500 [Nowakowskiella sp. JEL0078]|nr:hypothetical protein HK096_003500 [Nowakowskiella sp. JEL0078]